MKKKKLILSILSSYLAIFLIIIIINWYRTFKLSNLVGESFLFSLIFIIPLIIINYYCLKYYEIEKSKKYFLKILFKPLIIIFVILLVILISLSIFEGVSCDGGDMCGIVSLIFFFVGVIIIVVSIIALLLIGSIYYFLKSKQRIIAVGLIFLLIFFVLAIVIFTGKARGCPLGDSICLFQKALEKNDISMCEEADDEYTAAACYDYVAVELGDETICDFIVVNEYRKADCYEGVILGNNNACTNLSDINQKKSCLTKLCNKITLDEYRESCLKNIIHKYNLEE